MHDYIAEQIRQGQPEDVIRQSLIGSGYSPSFAEKLIADTKRDLPRINQLYNERIEQQEAGKAHEATERRVIRKYEQSRWLLTVLIGLGLFALGAAITIGTYWMAGPGGAFFVSGGLIFFGLLAVFKGIYHRIRWW